MYKIGVIGDPSSVLPFVSVGFSVAATEEAEEAREMLMKMAREDFAIIYITEETAQSIEDTIERYSDRTLPAIIVIPSVRGSGGYGTRNIKRSVERALGADILFKN